VKDKTENGFTLIEVMVGIAVSSILIVAVFQFLGRLITFREETLRRGLEVHHRVAVVQLLHQDLMSVPVGEMTFRADRGEFSRRTVTHETAESRIMDSKVLYDVRLEEGKEHLYREWKWSEIHDDFRKERRLISAEEITIEYRTSEGRWVEELIDEEFPDAVRIIWADRSMTLPVAAAERKI